MTNGPETVEEEGKAEARGGFDFDLLWLWPVLLLKAIIETFTGHAQRLKALRRADPRIADADWAMYVENLRTSEWMIRSYIAGHARRLLAGEALDLSNTLVPAPPDDWRRPAPRSVRDLLRRFEAAARVFAHPMRFIERYARRLIARSLGADPRHGEALSATLAACAEAQLRAAAPVPTPSWTRGIPAPP